MHDPLSAIHFSQVAPPPCREGQLEGPIEQVEQIDGWGFGDDESFGNDEDLSMGGEEEMKIEHMGEENDDIVNDNKDLYEGY